MGSVLVAGATGLVGEGAVGCFAASGWDVVAVSRRVPEPVKTGSFRHLPVDLTDADACRAAFSALKNVTHVVYAALYEQPGLVGGWTQAEQMQTNLSMLQNLLTPLVAAGTLRHVTLLQGTKAYGAHVRGSMPIPARERAPREDHENFYWLQEDDLRARAEAHGFAWTIFRPQIVIGAAWGAAMNLLLPISAFAAIQRELGQRFSFPGGAPYLLEMADPRLLGQAFEWAAGSPSAVNEIFNVANGDVFTWPEVWPAMAEAFGLEQGADETRELATFLPRHAETWERIVRRHDLRPLDLASFLGESHHYADALFRPGATTPAPPLLVSTIKLRQAGFAPCLDTEDTLRYWLGVLRERRLIPPLSPFRAGSPEGRGGKV